MSYFPSYAALSSFYAAPYRSGTCADGIGDKSKRVEIVRNFLESIDDDWSKWASFFVPSVREVYVDLVSNVNNHSGNIGVLTIENLKVISVTRVDNSFAPKIYHELRNFYASEENYECYNVCIDATVAEDNGYYRNGLSAHLVVLVRENGQ